MAFLANDSYAAGTEQNLHANSAGDQGGARIARLVSGGLVAIWSNGGAAYADTFDAAGGKIVADRALPTGIDDVIGLSDGGFAVAWGDSNVGIRVQRFDASGNATAAPIAVAPPTPVPSFGSGVSQPALAALADGGFAVSWSSASFYSASLPIAFYDATGTLIGSATAASDYRVGVGYPSLATLLDGSVVVSWEQGMYNQPGSNVFARLYDPHGHALGAMIGTAGATATNTNRDPAVAVLASGNFVLTWTAANGSSGTPSIHGRVYSAAGTPVGGEFEVDGTGEARAPSVTGLDGGNFLVSWTITIGQGNAAQTDIMAQTFDAQGRRAGPTFLVNSIATLAQRESEVQAFGTHDFAAAWDSYSADNGRDAVIRLFHDTQITGTAGDDELTGTARIDMIHGDAGNDRIAPGLGRDIVDGGAGTDLLDLSGMRASYAVFSADGHVYLLGTDGSGVEVRNIEQVQFGDGAAIGWATVAASAVSLDGLRYIDGYGDLVASYGTDAAGGIAHFVDHGFFEGRGVAGFDPLRYIASNPDILAAFGEDSAAATLHYARYGFAEGRSTASFDPLRYLASNPDLMRAYGTDTDLAALHFIRHGYAEGRPTAGFDALRYLASNPDLARAYGTDVDMATVHYIRAGFAEGRPITFDALLYGASYTDLAQGYGADVSALERHYIEHGLAEGRSPGGFDAVAYLLSNPDLAAADFLSESALRHWLDHGADEGRAGDALYGREQASHGAATGVAVEDRLDTTGDHDWFGIALKAGQTIDVALSGIDPGLALTVFDDHGRTLDTVAGTHDRQAIFALTADHDADYYFGISGSQAGNYELMVLPPV